MTGTEKRALQLVAYVLLVTVAAIWFGAQTFIKGQEIKALELELSGMELCQLHTVICEGEEMPEPINTTNASWYDYVLNDIPWSLDHSTAASREFERGTMVEVMNVANGKTVEVLINDYGPNEVIHPDRALDLSSYAFEQIADLQKGVIEVEYRAIGTGEYRPLLK